MPSGLWLPRRMLKPTAVVYYWNPKTDHLINALLPEIYPVPYPFNEQGYTKVVCRNAHELEKWSGKLRDQEARELAMEQARRELIEGSTRQALRQQLIDAAANANDNLNRDAARHALQKIDQMEAKGEKASRTSFQHMEGFSEKKR